MPEKAYRALAKSYSSPLLFGPPVSDELMALVTHMYTEDEADVVRHLKPLRPRTAKGLARSSGRPLHEVSSVLHHLSREMFIILAVGNGPGARYSLMPIVPGTFEAVLMRPSLESVSEWHREFARLYEALFDTGFMMEYNTGRVRPVRYIPVGEIVDSVPMALPSDRLECILDRFDSFSIALCQCRLSRSLLGDGCGRKLDTCAAFGDASKWLVANGKARAASRRDILESKAEAESEGMVTWMFNVGNESRLNGSCSCCGCCCGALRSITQFNMPGLIAPPHFIPRFERELCAGCDKCVKACPVVAIALPAGEDPAMPVHLAERCIGCGLCAAACPTGSITMYEAPDYREPVATWPRFAVKAVPEHLKNFRRVSGRRRNAGGEDL